MDQIEQRFAAAKKKYNSNADACEEIKQAALACLQQLTSNASQEQWDGPGGKRYTVFKSGQSRSRPFLTEHFMSAQQFSSTWDELLASADREAKVFGMTEANVTRIVYNATMPLCVCFDIWKSKSRKSPGTFFEIVLGTLISRILPTSVSRSKHIQLPRHVQQAMGGVVEANTTIGLIDIPEDELTLTGESLDESDNEVISQGGGDVDMSQVATDIVFEVDGFGIVIPAKTTTRERIVQPFAHQRILDGVFGDGRYVSLLICVSETQRSDKDRRVNEICVPGTITLFQKHLAKLGGIYYLDPPERYLVLARKGVLPVGSLGALLTSGLASIFSRPNPNQPA